MSDERMIDVRLLTIMLSLLLDSQMYHDKGSDAKVICCCLCCQGQQAAEYTSTVENARYGQLSARLWALSPQVPGTEWEWK